MKKINGRNVQIAGTVEHRCGGFAYRLDPDHQTFPAALEFALVAGGCCDRDDNLYVFTRDMDRPIVKLNPEGEVLSIFGAGLFKSTHFLYVTPENTLLCVDFAQSVVRELTADGKHIRDFGTLGVPSDSGYDTKIWRKRRRVCDHVPPEYGIEPAWEFQEALRTKKRAAPPFNNPCAVAMNSKGEYYFADGYGNVAVHKFSADGKHVKTWGGPGEEPGAFFLPHAIWIDPLDRVWVCDREADIVQVFDGEGTPLAFINEGFTQPSGIWGDDAHLYVVGRGGILTIFNLEIDIVARLGYFNSDLRAHDICGDSKGNLYLFPTGTNMDHQVIKLERL
ncbi:hypothetical protein LJC34_00850 [Oscillospiraceae bacterium OttesenSCG-928-G22]|nr:hypothetical protein [Oscillospiraceae bacterium OttesenSCG-928-G22]